MLNKFFRQIGILLLLCMFFCGAVQAGEPSFDESSLKTVKDCISVMKKAQSKKDYELAEKVLQKGKTLARSDWDRFLVHYYLSCLYFIRKDYTRCIATGQETLNFGKNRKEQAIYAAQINKIGEAYFALKKYDDALQILQPYLRGKDATAAVYRRNRMLAGEILFAQKKYDRSLETFLELKKAPGIAVYEMAKCNWYCGRIAEMTGRLTEAVKFFQENLKIDGKWFSKDSKKRLEKLQKEKNKKNQLPDSSFEQGGQGAWNRMIDHSYQPGKEDWMLDASSPFHGKYSLRNSSGRPLQLLSEGDICPGYFSIYHRSSLPSARMKVEVFTYQHFNRLTLASGICTSGRDWQRYALEIKVRWVRFEKGAAPLVVVLTPLDKGTYWVDAGQLESGRLSLYKDYEPQLFPEAEAEKRLLARYALPELVSASGTTGGTLPGRHGFTVRYPVNATLVPVDAVLPFAPGEWHGGGDCEVVSEDGRVHPVQSRVISRWPQDGSVRSFGVNFSADLQNGLTRFHLRAASKSRPVSCAKLSTPSIQLCAWDIFGVRYGEHEIVHQVESSGVRFTEVLRRGLLTDSAKRAFMEYSLRTRQFRKDGTLEIQVTLTNPSGEAMVLKKAAVFLVGGSKGKAAEYLQEFDLQKRSFRLPADGSCGAVAGAGGTLLYREASLRHPVKLSLDEQGTFTGWLWPDTARPVILSKKASLFREFVYVPDQGGEVLARLGYVPVAMADPEDFIRTGFFIIPIGKVSDKMPRTKQMLLPYEKFSLADDYVLNHQKKMLHGVFNYGDVYGDCGWGNLESYLDMSEIFYALGMEDARILGWGLKRAMHYRDYDVVDGSACYHSPNHSGGTRYDFSHSWPQGIVLHYLLTGSRRSADVIRQVIRRYCERPVNDKYIQGSRSLGRFLVGLSDFYALTGSRDIRRRFADQLDYVEKHELNKPKKDRTIFSWHGRTDPFHIWYGCYALMQMYRLSGEQKFKNSFLREMQASLNMDFFRHDLQELWCGLPEEQAWPIMLGYHSRHRGSLFYPNMKFYAELTGEQKYLRMARLAAYADFLRGERIWPMDSWRLAVLQDIDEDKWIAETWKLLKEASSQGFRNGDFSRNPKWFTHWHLPGGRQMSYDDAVESWPLPEKKEFPALLKEYQTRQELVSPWRGYCRNLAYMDHREFGDGAPSVRVTLSREWNLGRSTSMESVPVRVTKGHWVITGAYRCEKSELDRENLIQWNFTMPEKKTMRHYISMQDEGDNVKCFIRYCKDTVLKNFQARIHPGDKPGWKKFQWEFDCPAEGIATLRFLLRLGSAAKRTNLWFDDLKVVRTGDCRKADK